MIRRVWKPFWQTDVLAAEAWLDDQRKQGWALCGWKGGALFCFASCEPRDVSHHICPAGADGAAGEGWEELVRGKEYRVLLHNGAASVPVAGYADFCVKTAMGKNRYRTLLILLLVVAFVLFMAALPAVLFWSTAHWAAKAMTWLFAATLPVAVWLGRMLAGYTAAYGKFQALAEPQHAHSAHLTDAEKRSLMESGALYRLGKPLTAYNLTEMEDWLAECARRGDWLAAAEDRFGLFKSGEPGEAIYVIDDVSPMLPTTVWEYESAGYAYVTELGRAACWRYLCKQPGDAPARTPNRDFRLRALYVQRRLYVSMLLFCVIVSAVFGVWGGLQYRQALMPLALIMMQLPQLFSICKKIKRLEGLAAASA